MGPRNPPSVKDQSFSQISLFPLKGGPSPGENERLWKADRCSYGLNILHFKVF